MGSVNRLSIEDVLYVMLGLLELSSSGDVNGNVINPPRIIADEKTYFILGVKFITAFHDKVSFEIYTMQNGGETGKIILTSDFNVIKYECDLQDEDEVYCSELIHIDSIITSF